MREPTSAANPGYSGYSLPQSELRRREGIGRNLLDRLLREGDVDSYVLGRRIRYVVVTSWLSYIARCQSGTERDPVEKARAAEAYKLSVARSKGARATALARSGWTNQGKPAKPKKSANRGASPARSSSPPSAAEAPKKPSNNRRSARKETSANA